MHSLSLVATALTCLSMTVHAVQLSLMNNTRPRDWKACRSSSFDEVRVPFTDEHKKVFACCHSKLHPPFESNEGGKEKESHCCFPHKKPIDKESQLPCCGHGKKTEKNGKLICIQRDMKESVKSVKVNDTACILKEKHRWTDDNVRYEYDWLQQDRSDPEYQVIDKFCCIYAIDKETVLTSNNFCCIADLLNLVTRTIHGRLFHGCIMMNDEELSQEVVRKEREKLRG